MKKTFSFISTLLALIIVLSLCVPTLAFAEVKAFEARELTAYLYGMERSAKIVCLFDDDLPLIPYIGAVDYLDKIYTIDFTEKKNADGTFSITGEGGTMTVNVANDTVHFDIYEEFLYSGIYFEGSSLACDYCVGLDQSYVGEPNGLDIDFGKYDIDIVEQNAKVYFPLSAISDLFIATYNSAEYIDGVLYFLHTMDEENGDGYFDRSPVYNNTYRDQAMIDHMYNQLCFQIDYLYGMPSKAKASEYVAEAGFDKFLNEYSNETREIKQLLKSNDLNDFYFGLCYLTDLFDDGGHTVLFYDPLIAAVYYRDTVVGQKWYGALTGALTDEKSAKAADIYEEMYISTLSSEIVTAYKDNLYDEDDLVKEWKDVAYYYLIGDTAVFEFDSFVNEVVPALKWSLDHAAANNAERFVLDLSTNGGGSTNVLMYIISIITNKAKRDSSAEMKDQCTVSGNVSEYKYLLDLNLDGEFDEKDNDVFYDFDFAVLTTQNSFSCGNLLPVMAKENGIVIIGETSGGGSCNIEKYYLCGAYFYYMSAINKSISKSGEDVDNGAAVDYDLRKPLTIDLSQYGINDPAEYDLYDYSDLFDFDLIASLIDEFYAQNKPDIMIGDISGDGTVDSADATMALKYDSDIIALDADRITAGDVNKDKGVDSADATLILRYDAGIITEF